ncbi:unnamed protein product [Arctogadus glacialis]
MSDTDLTWALKNGDLDAAKSLLKAEDVNRTLEGGRKPLHYAADCGHAEILEYLLSQGADVNAPDKHGLTPLLSAIYEGHLSCVRILLEKGRVVIMGRGATCWSNEKHGDTGWDSTTNDFPREDMGWGRGLPALSTVRPPQLLLSSAAPRWAPPQQWPGSQGPWWFYWLL